MADRFQNLPASLFPDGTKTDPGHADGSVCVDTSTKSVIGPHMDEVHLKALNALAAALNTKPA